MTDHDVPQDDWVEIALLRHAETTSNRDGIWQGQGDATLSDTGEAQAAALGTRLAGERFDRVVCSDLTRTETTLRIALPDASPDLTASWREIDVGRWEGLSREEVAARFGHEMDALKRGEPIPVGGGESWRDLERRVDGALDELVRSLEPGRRALVMTHGGVIHALVSGLFRLRHRPPPRPIGRITNTAMTVLRFPRPEGGAPAALPGRTEVVRYNDAGHLADRPEAVREHLARGERVVRLVADPDHPFETDIPDGPAAPTAPWLARLGDGPPPENGRVGRRPCEPAAIVSMAHAIIGAPAGVGVRPPDPGRVAHLLLGRLPTLADYGLDADADES